LLSNIRGDCVAAKLRPGNVHSADGWLQPEQLLAAVGSAGAASRSGHSPACSNGWYSIRGTYWLMLSEGHLTRGRFAAMLQRIEMLALPAS